MLLMTGYLYQIYIIHPHRQRDINRHVVRLPCLLPSYFDQALNLLSQHLATSAAARDTTNTDRADARLTVSFTEKIKNDIKQNILFHKKV